MKQQVFNQFRNIIYNLSGISLSEQKVALVSARVSSRMRELNIQDYEEYLKLIEQDNTGNEVIYLLNKISTNTTFFFRESDHFDFLKDVMQNWLNKGQYKFRIWCGAASSGEEPYSILMTINEIVDLRDIDFKMLATDISTKVLQEAKQGIYKLERLKGVNKHLIDKYFIKLNDDQYQVSDFLRKYITFARLNLNFVPYPMKGPFDIVFLRNVMIYFDNNVRSKVVNEIYRLLKVGGYLLVGHSETLNSIQSNYKLVKPSIYMK